MTSVNEIRSAFLDYFKKNDHQIVPSSPLVPRNDPTLMFTNAGMVPFKNVFTGAETLSYSRAVSSQKCVRAGGKHNDLDNVGLTSRHQTFFEMLGNFSFGDYFKDQAIELSWTLLTKEFQLDKKRLLVTIYAEDDEAYDLWKKIAGLPDEKIIRIATSDNFWSMGEIGPCGPCSEIFFDHGDHIPGGPPGSPEEDGDRFIEIWNLVFMAFEQLSPSQRRDLPKPSIDTGMGLERMSAVLQGTHDNYQTDLFRALISASVEATGVAEEGSHRVSHRVIADHLRATSFLIADGVLPSNEGRGYVLRRIMRRAMRHAHLLGVSDPLICKLVPTLIGEMGVSYAELVRAEPLISETIKLEETRFGKTLERGLSLLDDASRDLQAGDILPGDVAFKLYDTYGFPVDMTEDALKVRNIQVDQDGFQSAMERQRQEARKAWAGSGEAATEEIWFELRDQHEATDFLGYETEEAEAEILALIKNGTSVTQLRQGDVGAIIVNQTPFYGQSGGQIGDQGTMGGANSKVFLVSGTQKKCGDLFVHFGEVEKGSFKVGDEIELKVTGDLRSATRANHSATHLLHEALRQILGKHVSQKGSLVDPRRLRFDFSHPKPMSPQEIHAVEALANEIIIQNGRVETRLMDVDEAIASGAMALFGEKYGDEVRVVRMGSTIHNDGSEGHYSVELCGGTHARRTGDIGLVKIISESAVAAGVRRIEALTAKEACCYLSEQEGRVRAMAELLKTTPEDLVARLSSLLEERKKLERSLGDAKRQLALGGGAENSALDKVRDIAGVRLLARVVEGVSPKDLRSLADDGKRQIGSGIVAIIGVTEEGKAGIVVGVTEDLTSRFDAAELVRIGAGVLGGKGGGGRPDLAQAGGPDGSRAEDALEKLAQHLKS